jgi:hypothetical protein
VLLFFVLTDEATFVISRRCRTRCGKCPVSGFSCPAKRWFRVQWYGGFYENIFFLSLNNISYTLYFNGLTIYFVHQINFGTAELNPMARFLTYPYHNTETKQTKK